MRNLPIPLILAASFVFALSARASENMCPDYPHYRKILQEGQQAIKSLPKNSSSNFLRRGVPEIQDPTGFHIFNSKMQVITDDLNELSKCKANSTKYNPNCVNRLLAYARRFQSQNQFDAALNLLAKMRDLVTPNSSDETRILEQIANVYWKCVLIKKVDKSKGDLVYDYLKDSKRAFSPEETKLLEQSERFYENLLGSNVYMGDPIDRIKVYLNLAALEGINGDTKKTEQWKEKALTEFLNMQKKPDAISRPKNRFHRYEEKCSYPIYLIEYSFAKGDEQNCRLLESHLWRMSSNCLEQLVDCYYRLQSKKDLSRLCQIWLKSISIYPQFQLNADKMVILIDAASEDTQPLFDNFLIAKGGKFCRVYDALKRRKWTQVAEDFRMRYLNLFPVIQFQSDSTGRVSSGLLPSSFTTSDSFEVYREVAQCDLMNNEITRAIDLFNRIIEGLSALSNDNMVSNQKALKRISMIEDDIKDCDSPQFGNLRNSLSSLKVTVNSRLQKLECLQLAQELNDAGWQLEKREDYKTACKMYNSALDIRVKNLGVTDRMVAATLVDLARISAMDKRFNEARSLYLKALTIYRSKPIPQDSEFRSALENYAGFLKKIDRNSEAENVYVEARKLAF